MKAWQNRTRDKIRTASGVIHCVNGMLRSLVVASAALMADSNVNKLAVPGVCLLISFLSYSSQLLFLHLDPGPLTRIELFIFNSLVLCIWVCYARACLTNPGDVRSAWQPEPSKNGPKQEETSEAGMARSRWCRRCEVLKPPRAHHCKTCGRFVL